jgi:hypothetical protein
MRSLPRCLKQGCAYALILLAPGSFIVLPIWLLVRSLRSPGVHADAMSAAFEPLTRWSRSALRKNANSPAELPSAPAPSFDSRAL